MTDIFPESREEEILVSTINGEEYDKAPESRIEALLLELKEVIEEGGGGGGTTNYNLLSNKPSINSVTLTGDKSSSDLGIPTDADLAGKQDVLPVTASGNDVAFNGDIIDGQGNTLSVLAEALTKTASGNPVVISDCAGGKARSLKTTINAIQDLHGYDKPWVGGAGKNKFENNYSSSSSAGITYTVNSDGTLVVTGTASNISSYSFGGSTRTIKAGSYVLNGCPSGGNSSTYELQIVTGGNTYRDYGSGVAFTVESDSTYILQILVRSGYACPAGGLLFKPMIRLATESDPTFAPYSNICPISGRTAESVNDHGKNFVDGSTIVQGDIDNSTGVNISDGSANHVRTGNSIVESNKVYTMSYSPAIVGDGTFKVYAYKADGTFIRRLNDASKARSYTFTTPSDCGIIRVAIYDNKGISTNNTTIQLEEGSVATAYEPYKSSSATIQLGQTVYGADINWDTGVGTLKTQRIAFDGSEAWTASNGSVTACMRVESPVISDAEKNSANNHLMGLISNMFKEKTPDQTYVGGESNIGFSMGMDGKISVCQTGSKNMVVADWKTWLATNPLQVEYKLATPTTIQLTPEQLEMLKGYNRVTIDNGTITLDYVAKAISGNDEEIAPLVGDKATKAYAVNDFIERNDGLYRVTASIASGASFTANNTVKMSIGEALTYLYNK